MLKLTGNSEQTFAAHNSINMNPLVYAEWNYNNFYKPYAIYNKAADSLTELSLTTSDFSGTGISFTSGDSDSSYITSIRNSTSGVKAQYTSNNNQAYANISGSKTAGYYKITFYAKANINTTSGITSPITNINVSPTSISTPPAGWTASSNFYFQVIPVSQNGYKPPFQYDLSDTASGGPYYYVGTNIANSSTATISWVDNSSAAAYDIYKSEIAGVPKYIATVTPTFTGNTRDSIQQYSFNNATSGNLFISPTQIMSFPSISNTISFSPGVDVYDTNISTLNPIDGVISYTNYYESEYSSPTINQSTFILDGIKFNKFEIYFYCPQSFNKISISLKALSDSGISTYSVFFDKFSIVTSDSWLFDVNDLFPIDSVFYSARPGEAFLNPFLPAAQKQNKPISYGYYNPDGMQSVNTLNRKNLLPSKYSKFNYYISPAAEKDTNVYLSAKYDNPMSINKIIFKYNSALTYLKNAKINIYDKNLNSKASISLAANTTDEVTEYVILYYQNGLWNRIINTNEPTANNYSPTELTDSGIMQNTVDDVSIIELVGQVEKRNDSATHYQRRLHVIELSPRLELDISGLVKELSIDKSIDAKNSISSFPIGYMNSDSANLTVSNIPVYKNGKPHVIFENISEKSTFKSLLREGVKITGAFISPQQDFTEIIPAFYMYVNTWNVAGLDSLSISCMDSTKYLLMSKEAPQYSSKNEGMLDTMVNIFALSGFSDFDYNQLKTVLYQNAKKTNYFWTDISSTLYDSLSSFFLTNQIGVYFDEYGIMKFKDLNTIINTYNSDDFSNSVSFAVTDKVLGGIGSSLITYIPNLITDGYNHEISPKPGKVIVNYKVPITFSSTDVVDNSGFVSDTQNQAQSTARVSVAPQAVFSLKEGTLLPYSYLKKGLLQTDSKISIDSNVVNSSKNGLYTFSGDAFIGGEVIGWSGMEYEFYVTGASTNSNYKIFLRDPSEIDRVITELQNSNPVILSIDYRPTGNLYGLERGKYGTQTNDYNWYADQTSAFANSKLISLSFDLPNKKISGKMDYPINNLSVGQVVTVNNTVSYSSNLLVGPSYPSQFTTGTTADIYVNSVTGFSVGDKIIISNALCQGFSLDPQTFTITSKDSATNKIQATVSPGLPGTGNISAVSGKTAVVLFAQKNIDGLYKILTLNSDNVTFTASSLNSNLTSFYPSSNVIVGVPIYGNLMLNNYFYVYSNNNTASANFTQTYSDPTAKSTIDIGNNIISIYTASGTSENTTTIVSPNFDAKNCNYFSTIFQATPADQNKYKYAGITLLFGDSNAYYPLHVGISWYDGTKTDTKAGVNLGTTAANYFATAPSSPTISIKDCGDGKAHRFSVFVQNKERKIHMLLDNNYVGFIDLTSAVAIDLTKLSNSDIPPQIKAFGAYAGIQKLTNNTEASKNNTNPTKIYEIYAAQWNTDSSLTTDKDLKDLSEIIELKEQYHFQSKKYLNNIVKNIPNNNKYYFWESLWSIKGFKMIDNIDFDYTPIDPRTAISGDVSYTPSGTTYQTDNSGVTSQVYQLGLESVLPQNLAKSNLMASPFKFSMAISNNSTNNQFPNDLVKINNDTYPNIGQYIALQTQDGKVGNANITPLTIYAQRQTFSNDYRQEKVFNVQNISNSIQIDSPWIQSKSDAVALMKNISLLNQTFNNEVTVSIFGNPLIQIGDFCQMVYSLKEIGYDQESAKVIPRYFFVKSVKHSYTAGFSTTLTLKPMFDIS